MKSILSFYMNLLLKLSQSFLLQYSLLEYSVCEVVSPVFNTFPQAFLEVVHHLLQHSGRNCCHVIPDVLFQVHRCPCFLYVHLALELYPEEEVAGVQMGLSCRPYSIRFSWDHVSWEHLVEDLHCNLHSVSRCPILLKLESLVLNTKSLQLQFQKYAKHLSVAGWICCYCPACLIFKEIGADHPKKCYTIPNSTLLRM